MDAIQQPKNASATTVSLEQQAIDARQAGDFVAARTLFAAAARAAGDLQQQLHLQIREACCLQAVELYEDAAALATVVAQQARAEGYLPELAEAPLAFTRQCFYCDTWDGHLWIAPDPARPGLVVAAGDSGHAVKFAPVGGDVLAAAVEGRPNPLLALFRWRPEVRGGGGQEASRQQA